MQTTCAGPYAAFVPLHALIGGVRTACVRLRTPCEALQTTVVGVQTRIAGQQTGCGDGFSVERPRPGWTKCVALPHVTGIVCDGQSVTVMIVGHRLTGFVRCDDSEHLRPAPCTLHSERLD